MKKTASILAFLLIGLTSVYGQIVTKKPLKSGGNPSVFKTSNRTLSNGKRVTSDNYKDFSFDIMIQDKNYTEEKLCTVNLEGKKEYSVTELFISEEENINVIYQTEKEVFGLMFNLKGKQLSKKKLADIPTPLVYSGNKLEIVFSENKKYFSLCFGGSNISNGLLLKTTEKDDNSLVYFNAQGEYLPNKFLIQNVYLFDSELNLLHEEKIDDLFVFETSYLSNEGSFYYVAIGDGKTALVKLNDDGKKSTKITMEGKGLVFSKIKSKEDKLVLINTYSFTDVTRHLVNKVSFSYFNASDLTLKNTISENIDENIIKASWNKKDASRKKKLFGVEKLLISDIYIEKSEVIVTFTQWSRTIPQYSDLGDIMIIKSNGEQLDQAIIKRKGMAFGERHEKMFQPKLIFENDKIYCLYVSKKGEECTVTEFSNTLSTLSTKIIISEKKAEVNLTSLYNYGPKKYHALVGFFKTNAEILLEF